MSVTRKIRQLVTRYIDNPGPLKRHEALAMLASGECRVMLRVECRHEAPGERPGAYQNGAADRCIMAFSGHDVGTRHPVPESDAGLAGPWRDLLLHGRTSNYVFGFSNFSQFKNWFFIPDGLHAEKKHSVLGVYIVSLEHSVVGQFQMIADQRDMIHLMDLPTTYELNDTLQGLYDAQEGRGQVCR